MKNNRQGKDQEKDQKMKPIFAVHRHQKEKE